MLTFFYLGLFFLITSKYSLNRWWTGLIFWIYYKLDVPSFFEPLDNWTFLNLTLTNGLLLIHPICILVFYATVLFWMQADFTKITNLTEIRHRLIYIVSLNMLALFLGGWWADQELNWGGWWNWDIVELIPLLFLLKFIVLLHTQCLFFIHLHNFFYFLLVLFFLYVRWDIFSSIHSFNFSSFYSMYNEQLCILIYILYGIFILFSAKLYWKRNWIPQFTFKLLTLSCGIILINVAVTLAYNCLFLLIYKTIFLNEFLEGLTNFNFIFYMVCYWNIIYVFKKKFYINSIVCIGFFFKSYTILIVMSCSFWLAQLTSKKYPTAIWIHGFILCFLIMILIDVSLLITKQFLWQYRDVCLYTQNKFTNYLIVNDWSNHVTIWFRLIINSLHEHIWEDFTEISWFSIATTKYASFYSVNIECYLIYAYNSINGLLFYNFLIFLGLLYWLVDRSNCAYYF